MKSKINLKKIMILFSILAIFAFLSAFIQFHPAEQVYPGTFPSGNFTFNGTVRLDNNGQLYASGGDEDLRIIRGAFNSTCGIQQGSGFTCTRTALGSYRVDLNQPFPSLPTVIVGCSIANPISGFPCVDGDWLRGSANNGSDLRFYARNGGSYVDRDIAFIAIGPK